jgi:LAS superfamily LD-carboxypeptidase LdcB
MAITPEWTAAALTGRTRSHIQELSDPRCSLHHAVIEPFLALRIAASQSNIKLAPLSSFRDFERQLRIWNEKCRGERPLLDRDGTLQNPARLSDSACVQTILHWSALPGASRHHWGTEIDVIDANALPEGVVAQLIPEEFAPGGPFEKLNAWLETHASRYGFYRPYSQDQGGVQPEPWHLSYAPVAQPALQKMSVTILQSALEGSDIEKIAAVTEALPEIFQRYVMNVAAPPAAALRPV